jgi:hypothetical protein
MNRAALMIALLLASPSARATVLVQLSTRQLAEQAEVVTRGKVLGQQVVEDGGRLWTESTLRVLEPLKGRARRGQTLVLRQPGGERGRIGMRVAGVARFRVGEEVLVFATGAGSVQIPVGMCQGKFEIIRSGGQARIRRDLTGAGLVRFAPDGKVHLEHRTAPDPDRPLAAFLGELRAALKGGAR